MIQFKLIRTRFGWDGIFGALSLGDRQICVTLERSYLVNGHFEAKVPPGIYECEKGIHRLNHMKYDFITYEIKKVPHHTDILLHWGNWNEDSDGCVLVGEKIGSFNKRQMISNSLKTFENFMEEFGKNPIFQICII